MDEIAVTAPAVAARPPLLTDPPAIPPRPEHVPEKFWDPVEGKIRVDALLKSYLELERKLAQTLPLPADENDTAARERIFQILGRPESPDAYTIQADDDLVADPEVNARLYAAGFTNAQAQLVYDLARERLRPLVEEAIAEVERRAMAERLAAHFGGKERWREISRQLRAWGEARLPAEAFQALASSVEGVLALHQMMRAQEPSLIDGREPEGQPIGESELRSMMRDPRYWRDRDPEFVKRVTRGFQKLYPG